MAANSFVLALHQKHLKPEQAMLAGMVHNLGALPLCIYADRFHPGLEQAQLEQLVRRFSARVGVALLENWHFPPDIVAVVAGYENLQRTKASGEADYVDVVTIANLLIAGSAKFVAWQNVSAVARLGCNPDGCVNFLADYAQQLDIAREMLNLPKTQAATAMLNEPAISNPRRQETAPPTPSEKTSRLGGFFGFFR